jgi:hypothetical protein
MHAYIHTGIPGFSFIIARKIAFENAKLLVGNTSSLVLDIFKQCEGLGQFCINYLTLSNQHSSDVKCCVHPMDYRLIH